MGTGSSGRCPVGSVAGSGLFSAYAERFRSCGLTGPLPALRHIPCAVASLGQTVSGGLAGMMVSAERNRPMSGSSYRA